MLALELRPTRLMHQAVFTDRCSLPCFSAPFVMKGRSICVPWRSPRYIGSGDARLTHPWWMLPDQVLLDGEAVGRLDRNGPHNLTLGALGARSAAQRAQRGGGSAVLDVVVEAVGRSNQGWRFDTKGLSSPDVLWNGAGPRCLSSPMACLQRLASANTRLLHP